MKNLISLCTLICFLATPIANAQQTRTERDLLGEKQIPSDAYYGVQTFMVSHDGVVYQKDLGPKTVELANAIELFNPDKTWIPVQDEK